MQTLYKCDLSIIIPVYNLERFIHQMLQSLQAQKTTYTYEVIFVLNNCTDKSEEVIREYGFGNIFYCAEQGCGPARNTGIEQAQGEYIWFMDGDDWLIDDTAIQTAMDKAKGHDIIRVPFLSVHFPREYFSMVWQYVFRREFVKEFRFPDYQPCEDDAYMEKVLAKAGLNRHTYMELPHTDKPLYVYNYLREGSNMYRYLCLREQI